jgi:hypothetical protein
MTPRTLRFGGFERVTWDKGLVLNAVEGSLHIFSGFQNEQAAARWTENAWATMHWSETSFRKRFTRAEHIC